MSTENAWTLREATNADGPKIWSLIEGVLREYSIQADLSTTDKDLADIEANYTRRGGAFFVLTTQGDIIGSVALARESDSTCELCRMYLAPNHRRKGLGRLMLNTGLVQAERRGFDTVRLETAKVLVEAIALYESVGFTTVDEAPTGRNCNVVMTKRLK
jgi:putative acetyltransferase